MTCGIQTIAYGFVKIQNMYTEEHNRDCAFKNVNNFGKYVIGTFTEMDDQKVIYFVFNFKLLV